MAPHICRYVTILALSITSFLPYLVHRASAFIYSCKIKRGKCADKLWSERQFVKQKTNALPAYDKMAHSSAIIGKNG